MKVNKKENVYSLDSGSMHQSRVAQQKSGQHLQSDSNKVSLKK